MFAHMQDGWDHMPHDILVAVVRAAGPKEARAMHLVCKAWHMAVRCGLSELTPRPKQNCFEGIRCFFPRVTLGCPLNALCRLLCAETCQFAMPCAQMSHPLEVYQGHSSQKHMCRAPSTQLKLSMEIPLSYSSCEAEL